MSATGKGNRLAPPVAPRPRAEMVIALERNGRSGSEHISVAVAYIYLTNPSADGSVKESAQRAHNSLSRCVLTPLVVAVLVTASVGLQPVRHKNRLMGL